MTDYFDIDRNAARLRAELTEWRGTPYRHWSGVKGLGADCIHFVVRIGEAVGFLPAGLVRIPHYPQRWHFHQDESLLLKHFEACIESGLLRAETVRKDTPKIGDIFFFKFGRTVSHAAYFCDGYFHHAVIGAGVQTSPWSDAAWQKRIRLVYRVVI